MNFKIFFFIILTIILINTCKSSDNNLLHFDPRILKENEITLSEIADDIAYIPLDNSIPLGLIYDKIKFINNSIFLSEKDNGILVFSDEGKFLRKIGSMGRGPGEYVYNFYFTVDEKTETIYVFDIGQIIKVFSKTGRFLRSFSLKDYGSVENTEFYNSNLFVLFASQFGNSDYEWIFCDTLGNVIKKRERHLPKFTTNWSSSAPIYTFENQLCYYNYFIDTVFSILPDLKERPSIIINPGERRLPRSNISPEQMMSNKYFSLYKIIETNRFLILNYYYYKSYLALIDKHNHESFLIDLKQEGGNYLNGVTNDIDGGHFFIPENYFSENGREYIVGLQYPYQIKARVSSDEFKNSTPKYPKKKKELEKLADSLKETDNPVLIMVRLKK